MLNILMIILISLIPIVFWAYIFSSLNYDNLNKKRFIIGIFSGIISAAPIYYMDNIISFLKFGNINFFLGASKITNFFSSINFSLSLTLFIFIILFFSLIISIIFYKKINIVKLLLKNIFIFIVYCFFIGIFFYILGISSDKLIFLNSNLDTQIFFKQTIFNTFKLIIIYYVLIAFIEETSKHFNFLATSIFDIKNIKDGVLYAIFVALGFSFIENILYLLNIYNNFGFNGDFIQTYFFRSIFSLMLHVFASSIIAFFFSKAYLKFFNSKLSYFKTISIGIFLAVFIHFIFNFFLELGLNFIMILFFVVGYLYISSIFYKQ